MIFFKKIPLKGIRTNCSTGEKYEVDLECELNSRASTRPGEAIFQLYGGSTGYESFYTSASLQAMIKDGWLACCGTKDRWDILKISGEEMKRVFIELEMI